MLQEFTDPQTWKVAMIICAGVFFGLIAFMPNDSSVMITLGACLIATISAWGFHFTELLHKKL